MIKFMVLVMLAVKVDIALSQCLPNCSSVYTAIDQLDKFIFPLGKFEPACLIDDCPSLKNLSCPFNLDGSINNDVCTQVLSILQTCLSKGGTICSTPIDPIFLCPVGVALGPLLSPSNIIGNIGFLPGANNTLTGLSGIILKYEPSPSYVLVSIPTLTFQGRVYGSAGIQGWNQSFSINDGNFSERLNVSLVLFVQNQGGGQTQEPNVTIQVTGKTVEAVDEFGQLLSQNPGDNAMSLLSVLLDLAAQTAVQTSDEPTDLGRFIGALISAAIQAAARKCASNNSD